jgi:trehalose-6-phosphatase
LYSSSRFILDELLGEHPFLWLSTENGFFLRKGTVQHANGAGSLGNVVHVDAIHGHGSGGHGHHSDQWHAPEFESNAPSIVQAHPWQILFETLDLSWKEGVARVFEYYTVHTPRTFIADGEMHSEWHYHDVAPVFARRQVNDLATHLTGGPLSNTATEVLDNSGVVQVRPLGLSKGTALRTILHLLSRRQKVALKCQRSRARKLAEDVRDHDPWHAQEPEEGGQ